MKTITRTRMQLLLLIAAAALIIAAVAVLLDDGPGTAARRLGIGAGSAGTGTTGTVVIHQTSVVRGLTPGRPARPLRGTISNHGETAIYVRSISAAVDPAGLPDGCTPADFTISGSPTYVEIDVPPRSTETTWSGITIRLNNTAENQDACKDVRVRIAYTAH
jgi:hypothetical protein